jgi:hypothetical protein
MSRNGFLQSAGGNPYLNNSFLSSVNFEDKTLYTSYEMTETFTFAQAGEPIIIDNAQLLLNCFLTAANKPTMIEIPMNIKLDALRKVRTLEELCIFVRNYYKFKPIVSLNGEIIAKNDSVFSEPRGELYPLTSIDFRTCEYEHNGPGEMGGYGKIPIEDGKRPITIKDPEGFLNSFKKMSGGRRRRRRTHKRRRSNRRRRHTRYSY